jgi:urease gamma subunit
MSKAAVFTFREIINTNEELQDELRDGASLIDLASRYRIAITAEDVRGALEEMRDELAEEEIGWFEAASEG